MRGSKKKPGAAAPALKPQGTKNKRTPQSFADGAAGYSGQGCVRAGEGCRAAHREGRRDAVPGLLRCRQDAWRPLKVGQR
jgi:hypothetical protein